MEVELVMTRLLIWAVSFVKALEIAYPDELILPVFPLITFGSKPHLL